MLRLENVDIDVECMFYTCGNSINYTLMPHQIRRDAGAQLQTANKKKNRNYGWSFLHFFLQTIPGCKDLYRGAKVLQITI